MTATGGAEWARRDLAVVHPGRVPGAPGLLLERGEGCTVFDLDGNPYLDAHGGAWLAQVGHGREELAAAAAGQMRRLAHFTSQWDYGNLPSVELAERLVALAPAGLTQVRYTSSGSESGDLAMQLVREFHLARGEGERSWILSRRGSYHGWTIGTNLLSGRHPDPRTDAGQVEFLTPPWPYHEELFGGQDPTDFLVGELEETIERIGPERIGAMFGEPVMGPAGMVPPPEDYWPRIQAVLRRHGILLVADEVVTACGRVGAWFASDLYGIEPDMVLLAKGLAAGYVPLGAVLLSDEIAAATADFDVGGSYMAHPAACAVALESLRIIEDEGLCRRAEERGAQLLDELAPLLELPAVGDVRGRGLMVGVELTADPATRAPHPEAGPELATRIRERTGVIVAVHGGAVAITPPLVISAAETTRIVAALAETLAELPAAS